MNNLRSRNFVVLSNSDFAIEGTFNLLDIRSSLGHGYIYSGYANFTWLIGLDGQKNLCFWLGDGCRWNIFNEEKLNFVCEVGVTYKLAISRKSDELIFEIDSRFVGSLFLPKNFYIQSSHLGIGSLKGVVQSWNFDISYPLISISDHKYNTHSDKEFRNKIHLLSMFYGEKYCKWLGQTMFPSLMLHGNLPSLQGAAISHRIYCSENELPLLNEHVENSRKLGIQSIINTQIIPPFGNQREALFMALVDAINSAIADDAIIVVAPPDHVFGFGLANVINTMKPYEYVVCGHPRVNERLAQLMIPNFLDKLKKDNVRSNRPLVSLAMSEMPHPMVSHGLCTMEPYWHGFENSEHYSIFFKEPPPLCFHPHPDMFSIILGETWFGRFETLDHDLVDYAFSKKRLRIIDDSEEFFWVELTNENTYNPTIKNDYYSDAAKRLFHRELKWYKNNSDALP